MAATYCDLVITLPSLALHTHRDLTALVDGIQAAIQAAYPYPFCGDVEIRDVVINGGVKTQVIRSMIIASTAVAIQLSENVSFMQPPKDVR